MTSSTLRPKASLDAGRYHFDVRPVETADLPLINDWIASPFVARWWGSTDGDARQLRPEELTEEGVELLIASIRGEPFAFVQEYDPHSHPDHHFAHLPDGARGLDLFIGRPELSGSGQGTGLVRWLLQRLFASGCPAVGIDPAPDNHRAIRAFEKAGFARTYVRDTQWGRCQLMEKYSTSTTTVGNNTRNSWK